MRRYRAGLRGTCVCFGVPFDNEGEKVAGNKFESKYAPELEDCANAGSIVAHEVAEGEEDRQVEGQEGAK